MTAPKTLLQLAGADLHPAKVRDAALVLIDFQNEYLAGPIAGGALVAVGGYPLLFGILAVMACTVAALASRSIPVTPPRPRSRETVVALLVLVWRLT